MRKMISFIEIAGGILGIVTTILLISNNYNGVMSALFLGIPLMPFILSLSAGILLWKKMKLGIILSAIIQLIQIPIISIKGFFYKFFSGFELSWIYPFPQDINHQVLLNIGGNLNWKLGKFYFMTGDYPELIGINLFALMLLVLLLGKDVGKRCRVAS
jgi:hypothetical protein